MFAPAQKNLSPAPRIRITRTVSSNRAFKIASSSARIISNVYVLAGGSFSSRMAMPFSMRYPHKPLVGGDRVSGVTGVSSLRVGVTMVAGSTPLESGLALGEKGGESLAGVGGVPASFLGLDLPRERFF